MQFNDGRCCALQGQRGGVQEPPQAVVLLADHPALGRCRIVSGRLVSQQNRADGDTSCGKESMRRRTGITARRERFP
jgi:hypothetical protein